MEFKFNKKTVIFCVSTIFLLSAIIYNFLYINNKKNEIIEEIESVEEVEEEMEIKTIFIDIGGEVNNPGLYELPEGARVNDAINIAGGITKNADLTNVNLAYILEDAIKILIPKKEVKKANKTASIQKSVVTTAITSQNEGGKININTATKEQLKELNGIGDATANKIINYRTEKGNFKNIEELKNISGIGDSKYNNVKEKICV